MVSVALQAKRGLNFDKFLNPPVLTSLGTTGSMFQNPIG
jgi:hypothetical protein